MEQKKRKSEKAVFILIESILALLIAVSVLVIYAVNRENREKKISVLLEDSESMKWAGLKYGIRMAAQDLNAEVFFVSTDSGWTVDTLQSLIEEEAAGDADAVLTLGLPGEEAAEMLQQEGKKVSLELIMTGVTDADSSFNLTVTEPDHYQAGYALGQELQDNYSGGIQGKTLGVLAASPDSRMILERNQGFLDSVKDSGSEVLWTTVGENAEDPSFLQDLPAVDLIVALDDESTIQSGILTEKHELHGAICYGIGDSMQSIYYLDTGRIECLVVPDSFQTGYNAVASVLNRRIIESEAEEEKPEYSVLYRDTLYEEENQGILLTLSQ